MKLALHWKILIGLFLGVVWAFISINFNLNAFTIDWIKPFGKIFVNLLKLIAVPLVLFSIIKGVSDLQDIKKLGALGVRTLGLYIVSTVLAIAVGLIFVNGVKPGEKLDEDLLISNRLSYELWVAETDGVEILDGKNYLDDPQYAAYKNSAVEHSEALAKNEKATEKQESASKRKDSGPLQILVDMVPSNLFQALGSNTLMLQVIFFALFFGIVLLLIDPKKAMPINQLVDGFNDVFLKMVDIVMKGAPFFVFALMAGALAEMAGDDVDSFLSILFNLGWYMLVVFAGLVFMAFIIYPLFIALFVKGMSPWDFLGGIKKAQTLAFSSSSSAATLPVTMECVNENLKVPKKITSFVLPIGATVNMDGTSLYISVAVVFLAQMHLVDLSIAQQLTIVLTATLASIGASAVPSAGLIMMIMVLQSVGLNPLWISIIFPVDRILDMCRTVVNVTGDATVATIIGNGEKEKTV